MSTRTAATTAITAAAVGTTTTTTATITLVSVLSAPLSKFVTSVIYCGTAYCGKNCAEILSAEIIKMHSFN